MRFAIAVAATAAVTVAAVVGLFLGWQSTETTSMSDPISPSSKFHLSDRELRVQQGLGEAGDCEAALKVSHHYSFVLNDFSKATPWLRIAARCPNANAKAELVYSLLGAGDGSDVTQEIDRLVLELEKIDPAQAIAVRTEVTNRRANKP